MAVPKKVALGEPLDLTDEQLDQLEEVTPETIEKTKVRWRTDAPQVHKTILDAQTIDEEPKP
jgi:hypothetical protein